MSLENHIQGSLDGLCGVYAIINAIKVGCGRGESELLFKTACKAISPNNWPDVLWSGTGFGQMQRMIKACTSLSDLHALKVYYPFIKNCPSSNEQYWHRLKEIFSNDLVRCAIVGIMEPSPHWTVIRYDGRVYVLDSTAGEEFLRKNPSSFFAGIKSEKETQWLLNPREVIIFSMAN